MMSVKLLCIISESVYNATQLFSSNTLGEEAKSWDTLDKDTRYKFIATVSSTITNRVTDPAVVHDNWLTQMTKSGWVWGEQYSLTDKTHPSMVTYDTLDDGQKAKDALYLAILTPYYGL